MKLNVNTFFTFFLFTIWYKTLRCKLSKISLLSSWCCRSHINDRELNLIRTEKDIRLAWIIQSFISSVFCIYWIESSHKSVFLFLKKTFFLHAFTTLSELPFKISTMTISIKGSYNNISSYLSFHKNIKNKDVTKIGKRPSVFLFIIKHKFISVFFDEKTLEKTSLRVLSINHPHAACIREAEKKYIFLVVWQLRS